MTSSRKFLLLRTVEAWLRLGRAEDLLVWLPYLLEEPIVDAFGWDGYGMRMRYLQVTRCSPCFMGVA